MYTKSGLAGLRIYNLSCNRRCIHTVPLFYLSAPCDLSACAQLALTAARFSGTSSLLDHRVTLKRDLGPRFPPHRERKRERECGFVRIPRTRRCAARRPIAFPAGTATPLPLLCGGDGDASEKPSRKRVGLFLRARAPSSSSSRHADASAIERATPRVRM